MNDKITAAVKEVLNAKERKFVESIDLSINLKDIDMSDPKNRLTEEIILPNGRGRENKIAVFGTGEVALKAKEAKIFVITIEELDELAEDKRNFKKIVNQYDFFIAEAPLMPKIGKLLGSVLGPRGKMPRPIPPDIDPIQVIKSLQKTVRLRSKDKTTFHIPVGMKNMEIEKVVQNIEEIIKRTTAKLDKGLNNIKSIYVKTSMGPAVKIELR